MPHTTDLVSPLLADHLALFADLDKDQPVLDLACGYGRNGLFLARNNIPVMFADKDELALAQVAASLRLSALNGDCWQVDLEVEGEDPLQGKEFAAVVAFNYLHRPLFESLRKAVKPGGLICYQTFTLAQRQFGRPKSAAYLLQAGELKALFDDWQVLHYFEGQLADPDRAIASLIARRP